MRLAPPLALALALALALLAGAHAGADHRDHRPNRCHKSESWCGGRCRGRSYFRSHENHCGRVRG